MHNEFVAESILSGKERLELTAATAAGQWAIDPSYDMNALDKWVNCTQIPHFISKLSACKDLYSSVYEALSDNW